MIGRGRGRGRGMKKIHRFKSAGSRMVGGRRVVAIPSHPIPSMRGNDCLCIVPHHLTLCLCQTLSHQRIAPQLDIASACPTVIGTVSCSFRRVNVSTSASPCHDYPFIPSTIFAELSPRRCWLHPLTTNTLAVSTEKVRSGSHSNLHIIIAL